MTNYLLQLKTPKSGTFNILLGYSEQGELVTVELRDFTLAMLPEQRSWLWNFLPKCTDDLLAMPKNSSVKVTELDTDLSFTAFWDAYNYKVGNKDRAKKAWDALDDNTKAIAMKKVREYNFYMTSQTHAKVFAERWLSQKRYENEFKTPH